MNYLKTLAFDAIAITLTVSIFATLFYIAI